MELYELDDTQVFYAVHEPGDATRYVLCVLLSDSLVTVAGSLCFVSLPRKLWEMHLPQIKSLPRHEALQHHFTSYVGRHIKNPHTALAAIEVVAKVLGIA